MLTRTFDFKKPPKTDFFFKLIDKNGILQHSRLSRPELDFGYSLDDNARALLVAAWFYSLFGKKKFKNLVLKFLGFLERQQTADGRFRNYLFISLGERFLSHELAEDAFGETIWALGLTLYLSPDDQSSQWALRIFERSLPKISEFDGLRTKAYCLIGLTFYLQFKKDRQIEALAESLSEDLVRAFEKNRSYDWNWFEDSLTYANAVLPWSLLRAAAILNQDQYLKVALPAFEFLFEVSTIRNLPSPVGQAGWYQRLKERAIFDQQPIEAGYLVAAAADSFGLTRKKKYLNLAKFWFSWFWGNNLLGLPLIDKKDGGCYDGLRPSGVNLNKGAESTLCYLLAYLSLAQYGK